MLALTHSQQPVNLETTSSVHMKAQNRDHSRHRKQITKGR